jgi:hypothetical protein
VSKLEWLAVNTIIPSQSIGRLNRHILNRPTSNNDLLPSSAITLSFSVNKAPNTVHTMTLSTTVITLTFQSKENQV